MAAIVELPLPAAARTPGQAQHVQRVQRRARLQTAAPRSLPAPGAAKFDRKAIGVAMGLADAALAAAGGVFLLLAYFGAAAAHAPLSQALPMLAAAGLLKLAVSLSQAYALAPAAPPSSRIGEVTGALALTAPLAVLLLAVSLRDATAVMVGAAGVALTAGLIVGHHALVGLTLRRLARDGALAETAVVVGATEAARRLVADSARTGELRILGVFDDRIGRVPDRIEGVPVLGDLDDLLAWDRLPDADRIIVTVTSTANARVRTLLERLKRLPNQVALLLDLDDLGARASVGALGDAPAAFLGSSPRDARRAIAKRVQDIVLGAGLAIATAPLMAIIALAIKLEDGGPILFRQRRHGFNNRIITVLKFRSMRVEADAHGPIRQVEPGDARITRLGRFLRTTSLDELPQLWNVLKGDMSLVGPRPHAVGMRTGEVECERIVADYAHRHRMKPGLTGWAQVNGSRGPLQTFQDVRERVRLDLDYVDRAGFWFDVWILLRTAPALLGDKLRTR